MPSPAEEEASEALHEATATGASRETEMGGGIPAGVTVGVAFLLQWALTPERSRHGALPSLRLSIAHAWSSSMTLRRVVRAHGQAQSHVSVRPFPSQ